MRAGIAYDVHELVPGRRLVLGGVDIPFEAGLDGHSDADVLVHAIIDALLGAACLGDIGVHFPSSDPKYKDISSLLLLREVMSMLDGGGWQVVNVDTTVVCERPRLADQVLNMRRNIAAAMHVDMGQVSVKCTTAKGLGFLGEGRGIAVHAIALLDKAPKSAMQP